MKKILIVALLVSLFGCTGNRYKVTYTPSFKDDPVRKLIAHDDSLEHPEKYDNRTMDELNEELDSLTAQGEYILVRGSDRNYDTIINHVHYIYTTEE